MYQYYLFDLDGTLTDPKIGITSSVQYALRDFGIEEENLDKLEPFIGPPLIDSFMEFYGMTRSEAEKAVVKYRERFSVKGKYENEIYDGIPELLKCLKEAGKRLAIASSKPTVFVKDILEYFHIQQYFDVIVGSGLDGSRNTKEEVVEEALMQLYEKEKPDPERTVMIGDRKFDIKGAKAHGLHSVGCAYGYAAEGELEKAGAEVIVNSVEALKEALLR